MLCPRENRTNKLSLRYEGPTQQEQQRCGKIVQKMNLHFGLKFRRSLDLFPASYGATPQLQHNSSWC